MEIFAFIKLEKKLVKIEINHWYFISFLEYRLISKKGEGTFSEVLKAQSIKTGKYVAIKCMKNHFDTIEQVSWK